MVQATETHLPAGYSSAGHDLESNKEHVPAEQATRTQSHASVMSTPGSGKHSPAGTANNAGPPHLEKFSYGLFAPEIKVYRMIVMKMLIGVVVLTTLVMWICTPFYWGSLWKANTYTHRLTVRVIDRDGGFIGKGVSEFLMAQPSLGYFVTPPSELPDLAAIEHDIVQEGAWGTIVINEGASARLDAARANADATYNPMEAIDFVFAQARSELATGSYLMPIAQGHLANITGQLSAKSVAQFLSSGGNVAALAAAPRTLSQPIGFTVLNIRPYDQPVATAITLVGLIYMLIFSFIVTMANNSAREIISPYLTTRAYLLYRILVPMVLYLPLSFFFAMINLPFKIHFGAHYTYAGGFFLWAFVLYLGMAATGLATEFAITIVGPRFVSFFLIPLIIVNVSGVSLPHELQPGIFRYAVAMPFHNASRTVRTIIFDTKNQIGQNCGILIAWIVVSIISITVATWLYRRKAVNQHIKAVGEQERDHKLPDGRVC